MKNQESFWITNISNMNISLSDLNVTIKALSSVNLLDKKHYTYTKEQLIKSTNSGSIFKRKGKLFVRMESPSLREKNTLLFNKHNTIPSREKSIFVIKEDKYEELNISDEDFALENADTAEMDSKPLINKK